MSTDTNPNFNHLNGGSSPEQMLEYGRFLSEHYAPEGAWPVLPTTDLIMQASREGLGPGNHVVNVTIGLVALQTELGFVTPTIARTWAKEDFIEYGHWLSHMLGSAEEPKIIHWDQLEKGSALNIAPSPERILSLFGSLNSYNDELGFVTPTTVDRWSDQDWLDNGRWFSHLLGSAEEPAMPGRADLRIGSRLSITPTLRQIYAKYGSLANYQKALGFSPKEQLLDYENWDLATYIENGKWLSQVLGTPEHPQMPTSENLSQATALGLAPPKSAILKRFRKSLAYYQDRLGFVTPATIERWTDQDWLDNGTWVSHMLGSPETPIMPTAVDFWQGSAANITPHPDAINEKFGSFLKFQEKLGFFNPNIYRLWTNRDYLRHGFKLMNGLGSWPGRKDYDAADGPSIKAIQNRFGSLAAFHERLGLPDYASYNADQLVNYGLHWTLSHDGRIPSRQDIKKDRRASKGLTLSDKRIDVLFENGFDDFKAAVAEAMVEYNDLSKRLADIPDMIAGVPEHLLKNFRVGEEYAADRQEVGEQIASSWRTNYLRPARLMETFGRSQLTIWWENDDFALFARNALGTKNLDHDSCVAKLQMFTRAGLAPMPVDIEEQFGGPDAFVDVLIEILEAEEAA